jgi:FeS assembly SUF system protein
MVTPELVREALRDVYDPEIPVNIVDLGLVYDIQVKENGVVYILMTLTYPGCPIGPVIVEQIEEAVGSLPGVKYVDVEFTFDPPWTPDKMSEEAKEALAID